ncbi:MAG: DedA family protein [Casimicrobiaceae bacterium]
MSGMLASAQPYLDQYGFAAVFGAILLESLGLPLPGETFLIAAALLASQGALGFWPLLLTAWAAAVIGDNIGYWIGNRGGARMLTRYGARLGITPDRMSRAHAFFARFGGEMVLGARFVPVLRQLNGIVAGTVGMPSLRFFAYNAIGAALWVGAWGAGMYYFGAALSTFGHVRLLTAAALGVVLVTVIAFVGLRRRQRNRLRGPTEGSR